MIQLPPRREIKFQAKRWMLHPVCLRVTLLLVSVTLGLFGLRMLLDGNLSYLVGSLEKYGDSNTGIYRVEDGFNVLFRMDLAGIVLALPVSYAKLRTVIAMNVLTFLILAPLRMGAMEQYWNVLVKKEAGVSHVFRWFTQPLRLLRALIVEFLLQGVVRFIGLLAMLPSLYCYYRFYTTTPTMESLTSGNAMLQFAGSALAFAAVFFTFWLHCRLLPLRYCLAAHPEYRMKQVVVRGRRSVKGYDRAFFGFRSTYLLWFAASYFTYFALDLFVLPYSSLGSMLYLQALGKAKKQQQLPTQEQEAKNEE